MGFFPPSFVKTIQQQNPNSLERIVAQFPPNLKKAMYTAAEKGWLKAGTWNGCPFNKAGKEISEAVHGVSTAASAFRVSTTLVTRFINKWDSMRVSSPTRRAEILKTALLEAGLTTPPQDKLNKLPEITRYTVYEGTQTRFLKELKSIITVSDIPGITDDEIIAASDIIHALAV